MTTQEAHTELERGVRAALETYSNVHRGSGQNSLVSTSLFEQARDIVLDYLGLKKSSHVVIFCTPRRATALMIRLKPGSYQTISSRDIGLSLGVRAMAVKRGALPGGIPFQPGGGTTKLVSTGWVIWADTPARFEAGTPAIINIIAFGKALCMIKESGRNIFTDSPSKELKIAEILYNDKLMGLSGKELLEKLRQTIIGQRIPVPTSGGERPYINLDNSASTPTFTPVWDSAKLAWTQPEKVNQKIIQEVRAICARILGAPTDAYDIIFTSNTTEAINLVAENLSREAGEGNETVVLNTFLEHSSNDLPWRATTSNSLIRLTIDDEGFVDLKELENYLYASNQQSEPGKKRIKIVAVSAASNVLGTCNNLDEIGQIVQQNGAHLLVDAAQLIAHRKVRVEACNIDYLAFSAHKVYAPFGCGVLVARKGLLHFNSTELNSIGLSGEENAGGIAALGKSLVLLERIGMDLIRKEEQELTMRALSGLRQIPGLKIYGIKDPGSSMLEHKLGVIGFTLKGMMSNRVAEELAVRHGIGVRSGCHCAHILVKRLLNVSPPLERFQRVIQTLFPRLKLPGMVRVSLGIENSNEDVDALIKVLGDIANDIQTKASRRPAPGVKIAPTLSRSTVLKQINDFARDRALAVYCQT